MAFFYEGNVKTKDGAKQYKECPFTDFRIGSKFESRKNNEYSSIYTRVLGTKRGMRDALQIAIPPLTKAL